MAGKVLAILFGLLLLLCVSLGVLSWYRGDVIDSQNAEIAQQKQVLEGFEKDKAAQEVADKQLKAEKERLAKERDKYKKDLKDALKGNPCSDAQLPDDAKRMLQELYNGKGS